ncbi:MAG: hypothetical protein ACREPS_01430 [Rhodanobacteraceae bacterium]
MNTKTLNRAFCLGIVAALALPIAGTAVAEQSVGPVEVKAEVNVVALLAQATRLTERQVQMALGARTAFAGYRSGYDFVERRFRQTLGPEMYERIRSQGELTALDVQNLSAMIQARRIELAARK